MGRLVRHSFSDGGRLLAREILSVFVTFTYCESEFSWLGLSSRRFFSPEIWISAYVKDTIARSRP